MTHRNVYMTDELQAIYEQTVEFVTKEVRPVAESYQVVSMAKTTPTISARCRLDRPASSDRVAIGRSHRGRPDRDAPVHQAAADLASSTHDCVETNRIATKHQLLCLSHADC